MGRKPGESRDTCLTGACSRVLDVNVRMIGRARGLRHAASLSSRYLTDMDYTDTTLAVSWAVGRGQVWRHPAANSLDKIQDEQVIGPLCLPWVVDWTPSHCVDCMVHPSQPHSFRNRSSEPCCTLPRAALRPVSGRGYWVPDHLAGIRSINSDRP